jgi:hypothetical protein
MNFVDIRRQQRNAFGVQLRQCRKNGVGRREAPDARGLLNSLANAMRQIRREGRNRRAVEGDDIDASARSSDAASSRSIICVNSVFELPRNGSRVTNIEHPGGSIALSSGSATGLPDGINTPARRRSP